jgi:hypothetical protein
MPARQVLVALALATLSIACGFAGDASAQVLFRSQGPCTPEPVACMTFTNTGDIPRLRAFRFTAPSRGTAVVQFHGSAVCEHAGSGDGVVIFQSQILDDTTLTPDARGPGGLQHGARMLPQTAGLTHGRTTFNLASTRLFTIAAAGEKTFVFKVARVNMSANTICGVFNATFTVMFTPPSP